MFPNVDQNNLPFHQHGTPSKRPISDEHGRSGPVKNWFMFLLVEKSTLSDKHGRSCSF